MGVSRKRRLFAVGGAGVVLAGTMIGAMGLNALPAGAAGGTVLSEVDCNTNSSAGQNAAPFLIGTTGASVTPDPSYPTGSGLTVTGDGVFVLTAPVVAAVVANLGPSFGISVTGLSATVASTDGSATGSYTWTPTFAAQPGGGIQLSGVTFASGATTLTGTATGTAAVGDSVYGTGISPQAVVTVVNSPTSFDISVPTTAAESAETIGAAGSVTYLAPFSTGPVFTAAGATGGTSNFGVTGLCGFAALSGILTAGAQDVTAPFSAGTPGACVLTGYDAGGDAGPGLAGVGVPLFPLATYDELVSLGQITPLVSVGPAVPPAGASTALLANAPVAQSGSAAVGEGAVGVTLQLAATNVQTATNAPAVTNTAWTLGTVNAGATGLTVSINSATGLATMSNTSAVAATASFTFTVTNSAGLTSALATITVNIGTPPVDQPINVTLNGGQLVLSCNAPGSAGYPLTACPVVNLPAVTLNGTQQTTSQAANSLYVSDNRGDPTVGWSLTTYMVPTATNPNAGCDTSADFCNSNAGADPTLPVNHIAASDLAIGGVACAPMAGNLNPAPTAGAGTTYAATQSLCTAAAGTNGGSFSVNGNFTLTVPSSTAAGAYQGTVEYLVA